MRRLYDRVLQKFFSKKCEPIDPCLQKPQKPSPCDRPCGKQTGLVLGAYDNCGEMKLTPAAAEFDLKAGGAISRLLAGAKLKRGGVHLLADPGCSSFGAVAVAGLGPDQASLNKCQDLDEARENIRIAAAAGVLELERIGIQTISVEDFTDAQAAAEGATLATWKYDELNQTEMKKPLTCIKPYGKGGEAWTKGVSAACGQNTARLLEEVPPNIMTPTGFAEYATSILCPLGVKVQARDEKWIKEKCLNAFYRVSIGSCAPPVFLELNYCGGPAGASPIVLVGKGNTFNSGGICLGTCRGIRDKRADLAGAAVIVGAFQNIAELCVPINITGLIPLYENMPGGAALKPGDVVFSHNGVHIRMENTANEGRVVLSDVLSYSKEYNPRMIVNIATLSPKMKPALGTVAAGLFTNSDSLWEKMRKAGSSTGDRVWRLPLWNDYYCKAAGSPTVDMKNEGKRSDGGDPCIGAAFLTRFIPEVEFCHIDVSGVGLRSAGHGVPYLSPNSMSGRPTRTLAKFLRDTAKAKPC